MEKRTKLFLIFLGIAVFAFLIWLMFSYSRTCENQTCFQDYLKDCKKANYINTGQMIFQYSILGKSNNQCQVNVKLLQGDLKNQDSIKLEKSEMICNLPLNTIMNPESDISLCHGALKEGLQELIIQKLQIYIVQNLGKMNADLLKIK